MYEINRLKKWCVINFESVRELLAKLELAVNYCKSKITQPLPLRVVLNSVICTLALLTTPMVIWPYYSPHILRPHFHIYNVFWECHVTWCSATWLWAWKCDRLQKHQIIRSRAQSIIWSWDSLLKGEKSCMNLFVTAHFTSLDWRCIISITQVKVFYIHTKNSVITSNFITEMKSVLKVHRERKT